MTSTGLQKIWMKDLPPPVILLAKKKAVEATAAWNDTVTGILTAAKAVFDVREKIGGAPVGSFSAWAAEELKKSHSTASCLAVIGSRYNAFVNVSKNLPAAWGTLYELAKAPDDVFRRSLRRVTPDMERNEMACLVAEETELPKKKVAPQQSQQKKDKQQLLPAMSAPEPGPREAARTTTMAGSVLRAVKDLAGHVDNARAETKKFMVQNYIDPSIELLNAIQKRLAEDQGS